MFFPVRVCILTGFRETRASALGNPNISGSPDFSTSFASAEQPAASKRPAACLFSSSPSLSDSHSLCCFLGLSLYSLPLIFSGKGQGACLFYATTVPVSLSLYFSGGPKITLWPRTLTFQLFEYVDGKDHTSSINGVPGIHVDLICA